MPKFAECFVEKVESERCLSLLSEWLKCSSNPNLKDGSAKKMHKQTRKLHKFRA